MASATEAPAPSTVTETEPEGPYEVIDGQIVEKPPMGIYEAEIASLLQGLLDPFARSHRLGRAVVEGLFLIDPDRGLKRRPDLAFVSHERWPLERRAPRVSAWEVVPDLAIEVISPSNSANAVQDKIGDYFRAGVRLVWVVYPLHALVQVHESPAAVRNLRAEAGDELDGGAVVPGFRVALATLFGEPGD